MRCSRNFLYILYYTILALHVSGAICTHQQENKLSSTAVGTRDCYGVLEVERSSGAGWAGTPSHLQHGQLTVAWCLHAVRPSAMFYRLLLN
jgi:hypothetical protein